MGRHLYGQNCDGVPEGMLAAGCVIRSPYSCAVGYSCGPYYVRALLQHAADDTLSPSDWTFMNRRGTTDVVHKVVAVGSRHGAVQKAVDFIGAYAKGEPIRAYGTYEEVFADPVRGLAPHNGPSGNSRAYP